MTLLLFLLLKSSEILHNNNNFFYRNLAESLEYLHHKLSLNSETPSTASSSQNSNSSNNSGSSNGGISIPSVTLTTIDEISTIEFSPSASPQMIPISDRRSVQTQRDYLHPKYSLPFLEIDIADQLVSGKQKKVQMITIEFSWQNSIFFEHPFPAIIATGIVRHPPSRFEVSRRI